MPAIKKMYIYCFYYLFYFLFDNIVGLKKGNKFTESLVVKKLFNSDDFRFRYEEEISTSKTKTYLLT